MKKLLLFVLSIALINMSCEDDKTFTMETIVAKQATDITYNSFQANWTTVNNVDEYILELSNDKSFTEIIQTKSFTDKLCCSHIFTELDPSMIYYYRIKFSYNEEISEYSSIITAVINRTKEDFTVKTADNITIKATKLSQIQYKKSAPVVIFIHSGRSNRNDWVNNELFSRAVDEGYISIAYDIRGHGESGGEFDLEKFKTDPNCLPSDLNAIFKYIDNLEGASPNRIGIIGGSLGASIGVGASNYNRVKSVVSLTCPYTYVKNLYGTSNLNTVFYVVGELDSNYTQDTNKLYDETKSPRKLKVVSRSNKHGVKLINNNSELTDEVFDWIQKYI